VKVCAPHVPAGYFNVILQEIKMAKKAKIPDKYQVWIDTRKKFHLSHAHVQMARELGMNPKKFGKLANHKQELWRAPLPVFIEKCYYKRFKKERPDAIRSIEQLVKDVRKKKEECRARKVQQKKEGLMPEEETI